MGKEGRGYISFSYTAVYFLTTYCSKHALEIEEAVRALFFHLIAKYDN